LGVQTVPTDVRRSMSIVVSMLLHPGGGESGGAWIQAGARDDLAKAPGATDGCVLHGIQDARVAVDASVRRFDEQPRRALRFGVLEQRGVQPCVAGDGDSRDLGVRRHHDHVAAVEYGERSRSELGRHVRLD
jgi:hypothetical protein